jgi:hypothetical protein
MFKPPQVIELVSTTAMMGADAIQSDSQVCTWTYWFGKYDIIQLMTTYLMTLKHTLCVNSHLEYPSRQRERYNRRIVQQRDLVSCLGSSFKTGKHII